MHSSLGRICQNIMGGDSFFKLYHYTRELDAIYQFKNTNVSLKCRIATLRVFCFWCGKFKLSVEKKLIIQIGFTQHYGFITKDLLGNRFKYVYKC